jgi:sulfur-oxidizing protein SoxZ
MAAFARISVPLVAKRGDAFEVRVSIRHAMETGYRVDDVGKAFPRNTVREIVCRYNGAEVLRARTDSGIAANPYLRFWVDAVDSGDIVLTWVDDAGERGEARASVRVSA